MGKKISKTRLARLIWADFTAHAQN